MNTLPATALKQSAVSLLAKRNYSRQALRKKLQLLSNNQHLVNQVLDELEQDHSLKDDRLAEHLVQQCINKGHGPLRIKQDLQQKGIPANAINDALETAEINWHQMAEATRYKKFGEAYPVDPKEKSRQIRFLQYRGFPANIVMRLFSK